MYVFSVCLTILATLGLNSSSASPNTTPVTRKSWTHAWHRFCKSVLPHEASVSEAISEAEKVAYEPDEGVEEFAEKLKYTIVSSYLLGSTLSISMYDHRHEALAQPKNWIPSAEKIYFAHIPPACHEVSVRIVGSLSVMPMVVIILILCAYFHASLPLSYCILLSIGLDALVFFRVRLTYFHGHQK